MRRPYRQTVGIVRAAVSLNVGDTQHIVAGRGKSVDQPRVGMKGGQAARGSYCVVVLGQLLPLRAEQSDDRIQRRVQPPGVTSITSFSLAFA